MRVAGQGSVRRGVTGSWCNGDIAPTSPSEGCTVVVIDFPHSIFFLQVSLSVFHTHGWEFRRVVVAIAGVQQDGAGVPQVETHSGHLHDVFPMHLRRFGYFA